MRKKVTLLLMLACPICHAQLSQKTINAMTWGAKTKITFQVVDYDGRSVSNANIRLYWTYDYTNKTKKCSEKTSKDGLVVLEEKSRGTFTYFVEKDGYYKSQGEYSFDVRGETRVKGGRWEPWNPTVKVLLKEKKENPVPLFLVESRLLHLPLDKTAGFDFMKEDWIAPLGSGEIEDVSFRIVSTNLPSSTIRSADQLLVVANTVDSGFLLLRKDMASQMKSVYHAPTNGFDCTVSLSRNRDRHVGSGGMYNSALKEDEYFVFRVRVEKDDKGKIVKSKYGKIYELKFGDEGLTGKDGYIQLYYYINPEDNNTNLEWNGHDLNSRRKYDLSKILAPL